MCHFHASYSLILYLTALNLPQIASQILIMFTLLLDLIILKKGVCMLGYTEGPATVFQLVLAMNVTFDT
jgi:hypothetical protein